MKRDDLNPEAIKSFFDANPLLSKACMEIGMDRQAVRTNLNGSARGIKLVYAVLLGDWIELWIEQEARRKSLASDYERLK